LKSRLIMFGVIVGTVFLILSFFWNEYGFIRMWILDRKIDKLEKEIIALKVEKHDLLWEIDKMKNDPEYLKKYAVEKYGYARPDQKVIQFVPPDSSEGDLVKQISEKK
jgi:cell division protein FtsB